MVLCKVCGQGIAGILAVCSRCATPHHKECFDFVESCAIYACGGRRYETIEISGRDEREVLEALQARLAALITPEDRTLVAGEETVGGVDTRSAPVSELLRYKTGLLRELTAAIAKAGSDAHPTTEVVSTAAVDGGKSGKTFVADELVIDSDPRAQDRRRKIELLRQMASSAPDLEEGFIARVKRMLGMGKAKPREP